MSTASLPKRVLAGSAIPSFDLEVIASRNDGLPSSMNMQAQLAGGRQSLEWATSTTRPCAPMIREGCQSHRRLHRASPQRRRLPDPLLRQFHRRHRRAPDTKLLALRPDRRSDQGRAPGPIRADRDLEGTRRILSDAMVAYPLHFQQQVYAARTASTTATTWFRACPLPAASPEHDHQRVKPLASSRRFGNPARRSEVTMTRYLITRLLLAIPRCWPSLPSSFVILALCRAIRRSRPRRLRAAGCREALRERMGLTDPLLRQYADYLQFLRGDLAPHDQR